MGIFYTKKTDIGFYIIFVQSWYRMLDNRFNFYKNIKFAEKEVFKSHTVYTRYYDRKNYQNWRHR